MKASFDNITQTAHAVVPEKNVHTTVFVSNLMYHEIRRNKTVLNTNLSVQTAFNG